MIPTDVGWGRGRASLLAYHFLVELVALGALAVAGWRLGGGGLAGAGLAALLAVGAAVAWGTFRVPNDPGPARVAIPGPARLALELGIFFGSAGLLAIAGAPEAAAVIGLLMVADYAVNGRPRLLLAR